MCQPYVQHYSLPIVTSRTDPYFSQVFDNYAVTVMIGEDPYTLGLFDTAGSSHSPLMILQ